MTSSRRSWLAPGLPLGLALVVSAALLAAGVSALPAYATAAVAVAVAVGRTRGLSLGAAASLGWCAAGLAIAIRITPYLGWSLGGWLGTLALATGLLATLLVLRRARRGPPPSGFDPRALVAGVLPIALSLALVIVSRLADGARLAWAMRNDAAWTLVSARYILRDGGVVPGLAPNPAPGTAGWIAALIEPGRGGATRLLHHDLVGMADVWSLALLAASLLAAAIAWVGLQGLAPWQRTLVAGAVGLVPWSWLLAGHAMEFGFVNAPIAFALLLGAWLAWLAAPRSPDTAMVALSGLAIGLLATWAPLAVVPIALGAWLLLSTRREGRGRLPSPSVLVALGVLVLYVGVVVVPDLLRSGEGLANDGGIFALPPSIAVLGLMVALLVAVLAGNRSRLLGTALVVSAGLVAIVLLALQRQAGGLDWWGYYPIKLAWLLLGLLAVMTLAAIPSLFSRSRRRWLGVVGTVVAASLALAGVAYQPSTREPDPPAISVLSARGLLGADRAPVLAFRLSGERTLVSRYDAPAPDGFVNFWMLSEDPTGSADPARLIAYRLDSTDPAQVCEAADAWGGDVTVLTSDPDVVSALESCSAVSRTVLEAPEDR